MRDHHHCPRVLLDQLLQVALAGQVQVVIRLVQQQHRRAQQQQARQPDQLLLPTGEQRQGFVQVAFGQPQP